MSFPQNDKDAPYWIQPGAYDGKFDDSLCVEIPNLTTDAVLRRGAFKQEYTDPNGRYMPLIEFDAKPQDMPSGEYSGPNMNAFVYINFVNLVKTYTFFLPNVDSVTGEMIDRLTETIKKRNKESTEGQQQEAQLQKALLADSDAKSASGGESSDMRRVLLRRLAGRVLHDNPGDFKELFSLLKHSSGGASPNFDEMLSGLPSFVEDTLDATPDDFESITSNQEELFDMLSSLAVCTEDALQYASFEKFEQKTMAEFSEEKRTDEFMELQKKYSR